jgi:hypothetical protein
VIEANGFLLYNFGITIAEINPDKYTQITIADISPGVTLYANTLSEELVEYDELVVVVACGSGRYTTLFNPNPV